MRATAAALLSDVGLVPDRAFSKEWITCKANNSSIFRRKAASRTITWERDTVQMGKKSESGRLARRADRLRGEQRLEVMANQFHAKRLHQAAQSLEGLSCGDAFGERFFLPDSVAKPLIQQRALPAPPWFFTDDTVMALSILETLAEHGEINQDYLARSFASRYDPGRGYGPAMHKLLATIRRDAQAWRVEPAARFRGEGSYGNGSAMRVAPLGAYFADNPQKIIDQARLSSVPTHTHREAVAGAVAVALATGKACHMKGSGQPANSEELLQHVYRHTPESHVRQGIRRAIELPSDTSVEAAVAKLGNGSAVTAPDTVPFALWCADRHLNSYEDALWATVSGLGDRDTTCAIVGGIVVMYTGVESIPVEWLEHREQIPQWVSRFYAGDK
jgi:ADP-ribosylglycohydrolase